MQPCGVNGCWCTDNGKISINCSGLAVHPGVVAMFLVQWCCRNFHYGYDCVANSYLSAPKETLILACTELSDALIPPPCPWMLHKGLVEMHWTLQLS